MELARKIAFPQLRGPTTKASGQFSMVPLIHFSDAAIEAFTVEFSRFLDQTDGVTQPEQLLELSSAFALKFACPWIAYGSRTPDRSFLKSVRREWAIILKYPDEWRQRYFKMGYGRIDPIIKASVKRAHAFRWSEMYKDASTTEDERRILDEAAMFGLRSGISVPLRGPNDSFAIMSFAQPCNRECPNRTISYLQFAAVHFQLRAAKFENQSGVGEVPKLSLRERECILWVTRGKSSWETGKILGISVNTVNFHIKNVMRKLNAANRTAAAIKAVSLGIIDL
ncbi:LuxR family transcriptional regulator [Mesorhizobium sp. M0514]|uniref:LuxR family transcriptional regulator n=1 Tax=Mesorhizobium sp. M0514 TaxID=2956955 RepID=UPI00333A2628